MPDNPPSVTVGLEPKPDKKSFEFGSEKLIGYLLLTVGILMIFAATYMAYGVLTGKNKPPTVFNIAAPSFKLPTQNPSLELPEGASLPAGLKLNQTEQSQPDLKIIPDEVFNGSLNIGLYYLAMMFLASSGSKIAGLGVKMIKDIKVQIKENEIKPG